MTGVPTTDPEGRAPRAAWGDRWLLHAFQRLGHPAVGSVGRHDLADTAWEALEAAGADPVQLLETACALSRREPAPDLAGLGPSEAVLLDRSLAARYGVVPLGVRDGRLQLACANPFHPDLQQDLEFATGVRATLYVAPPQAIRRALSSLYATARETAAGSARLVWAVPDRSRGVDVVPLRGTATETLDEVLVEAVDRGASDLHLEPRQNGLLARFRVDGVLSGDRLLPDSVAVYVLSRLKIMAGLDIADRLRPQDGRATLVFDGRPVDLRVSTLPLGRNGEKAVIRILDAGRSLVDLGALGFGASDRRRVEMVLRRPEGMFLVTGPTGCGKTTTLYSALRHVQSERSNVVTVEDPIEYRLEGVNQVQIHERSGLTFSAALRSILRQDPDVVLVGEIRDAETASIAVRASMTGHLVLSTLHTNDAISAVARLLDMEIDAVALSTALHGVLAQRLIRRLCPECRRPVALADLPIEQQQLLSGRDCGNLRAAVGCPACRATGYRGRTVVAELLVVGDELRRAIARREEPGVLAEQARREGMRSLWSSGLDLVLEGVTSLHELLDNVGAPTDAIGVEGGTQAAVDDLLRTLVPGPPAPRSAPPARPTSARAGGGGRVLVVDDDREGRLALRGVLEAEGLTVLEAADGETARAYIQRLAPVAVVSEVPLPKLDAIGLLQALEGRGPPVLIYTRERDEALHHWLRELGAADVIVKPGEVVARLRAVIALTGRS
jgi:type II secretory ATPase GspE/PulE/Tfp pilus assembly ATPase PilB-like protein/CheY-like chemotaxis protein